MMNPAQSPLGGPLPGAIRHALFDKQPPSTVRKSNFFSFTVQLQDGSGQRLRVRTAKFVDFLLMDWPAPPMSETSEPLPAPRSRTSSRSRSRVKQEPLLDPTTAFSPQGTPPVGDRPTALFPPPRFGEVPPTLDNGTPETPVAPHGTFLPAKSNAIEYEVELEHPHGRIVRERLFLCLVDNRNLEVVHYEGQDRNPEMRRVLLTHEVTCSRCSNNATGCGNKTAAPSDPTIHKENGDCSLIFHVKCNQNCLRTPGSPKQGRRFKLLLSTGQSAAEAKNHQLGISSEIFVHNNSKHGRQLPKQPSNDAVADSTCGASSQGLAGTTPSAESSESTIPSIALVWPKQGWTTGGQKVAIIGENFNKNMQVVFGHHHVEAEIFNSRILLVTTPAIQHKGKVEITLMQRQGNKVKQSCTTQPGHYYFVDPVDSMECVTERLQSVLQLPIHTVVDKEDIFSLLHERLLVSKRCPECRAGTRLPPTVTSALPSWPMPQAMKRPHSQTIGNHSLSNGALSPSRPGRPAPLVIPDSACNHRSQSLNELQDMPQPSSAMNPPVMSTGHAQWNRSSSYPPPPAQHQQQHHSQNMSGHSSQSMFFSPEPTYVPIDSAGHAPAMMMNGESSMQSSHPNSPSPDCIERSHGSGHNTTHHDDPISLTSKDSGDHQAASMGMYGSHDASKRSKSSQPSLLDRPPSNHHMQQQGSMQPPPPHPGSDPGAIYPMAQHHFAGHMSTAGNADGIERKPVFEQRGAYQIHHPAPAPGMAPGAPGAPATPGMAVYFPGGTPGGGQNASGVPYAFYSSNLYSPSGFALASPASFAMTPGHGESIFTFPPPGTAPPPSGRSLPSGQPLTPILVMQDPSSSAYGHSAPGTQSMDMSGGGGQHPTANGYPAAATMSHYQHAQQAVKKPPPPPGATMIAKPMPGMTGNWWSSS